ncbi:MAG: glycosyltransferase family 4 protein [Salinibacter sp.]|uniref:glycosyltransferase family 4 protein n=1 Tax=Salinibacter sp. TaxID=2065818 RepID=UPI0035D4AE31
MRICLLAEAFYPIVGGAESHSKLLARELVNRGHEVVVVTRRVDSSLSKFEQIEGADVHRVPPSGYPRLGKYFMIPAAAHALYRLRHDYDLIYVCGLRVLGVVGVVMAKLFGKACVLRSESEGEMAGAFVRTDFVRRHPVLDRFLTGCIQLRNQILMEADRFVSISTAITEEYLGAGVDERQITMIPNGVDTERFRPPSDSEADRLRSELGLPEKWLLTYTGKLNRGKGLTMLLEAWRELMERAQDLHLVLVGSGSGQYLSCEGELRTYVREHSLEEHITFTGYVENVEEYLIASDGFVLPSQSEGLPLSLIEAMACGLHCIGTRVGGIPDVVTDGENGILVVASDSGALKDAIWQLYSNREEARKLGENARTTVEQRFSMKAIAEAHVETFVGVLEDS